MEHRGHHSTQRRLAAVVSYVVLALASGGHAAAVEPTGTSSSAPAEPLAPPVANSANLGTAQCAPPTTTVVSGVPWAQVRLAPQRAWTITKGAGQIVAVIDSGVDAAVPQLAGHVLAGFDAAAGHGTADADCLGHGTFVAGIIAAQSVNGIGFVGVAPGAVILPVRQTDSGSRGTADGMASAIRWAVNSGAKVINVSAASQFTSTQLAEAVDYATKGDVLIVASVSNDAQSGNPKAYPAAYPGVVAVAAIGQNGQRADFSETGGYVSVAAPGANVLSVGPRGNGHLVGNGTSFAAPYVTGVAALVRAAHPNLSAAQVKHRLEATADHPSSTLPDPQLGWGVVNPYAAVTDVLPEESGARAITPKPLDVPAPVWPLQDRHSFRIAVSVGVACAALALLTALVTIVLPNGRRRGWRSADAEQGNPATLEKTLVGK
jgi:membrane-anchored mycosin MYCP